MSATADTSRHFVVRVSAERANGKARVKIWSSYTTAIEAERMAARLRSFGWNAWAADLQADRSKAQA
jgi:hypothetical protein